MFSGPVLVLPRLLVLFAGAWLAGMIAQAAPALADLRVCNETANQVSIALGYRAESGWQSEGWWVAPPSQCAVVYQGDLSKVNSSFFYLFAADDVGGGSWGGQVFMCTRDETFTIYGVEDCLARGYERTGFFEVDTQNRSDWMLQLTPGSSGSNDNAGTDAPDSGADQTVPLEGAVPLPDDNAPVEGDVPPDGEETTE